MYYYYGWTNHENESWEPNSRLWNAIKHFDNLRTLTVLFDNGKSTINSDAPEKNGEFDMNQCGNDVLCPLGHIYTNLCKELAWRKAYHGAHHDEIRKENGAWSVPSVKMIHVLAVKREAIGADGSLSMNM